MIALRCLAFVAFVASVVKSEHDRAIFDQNYVMDTSALPWIDLETSGGALQFKPLRSSRETGMFSCIMKLKNGTTAPDVVHLGTSDFLVLDGELSYEDGYMAGKLGAGKDGALKPFGVHDAWMPSLCLFSHFDRLDDLPPACDRHLGLHPIQRQAQRHHGSQGRRGIPPELSRAYGLPWS